MATKVMPGLTWDEVFEAGQEPSKERLPRGVFKTCNMEGCEKPHHTHGLCNMHRMRWSRHGDPNIIMTRRVTRDWKSIKLDNLVDY